MSRQSASLPRTMREAGTLSTETAAQRISDYLLTQGITTQVIARADHQGFELWVLDEEALPNVKAELERFRRHPDDDVYRSKASQAAAIRKAEAEAVERARKQNVNLARSWRQGQGGRRTLTYGLIGVSVVMSLLTQFGRENPLLLNFLHMAPSGSLDEILSGQVWRLVTPIFLHLNILHLLFNMWWLRDLGSAIEGRRGSLVLLLLVMTIAVFSDLGQFFFFSSNFGGMSGVIYGLFGYVWVNGRLDPRSGFFLEQSSVYIILGWLVLGFTGLLGPMANGCHLFGLVGGVVAGYIGSKVQ